MFVAGRQLSAVPASVWSGRSVSVRSHLSGAFLAAADAEDADRVQAVRLYVPDTGGDELRHLRHVRLQGGLAARAAVRRQRHAAVLHRTALVHDVQRLARAARLVGRSDTGQASELGKISKLSSRSVKLDSTTYTHIHTTCTQYIL